MSSYLAAGYQERDNLGMVYNKIVKNKLKSYWWCPMEKGYTVLST